MKRFYIILLGLLLCCSHAYTQNSNNRANNNCPPNPPNCIPNILVNQNIDPGQVTIYRANNSVTGTNTIDDSGVGIYRSAGEIILSDNFNAAYGSNFDAIIKNDCDVIFSSSFEGPSDPYYDWQWGHQNFRNAKIYNDTLDFDSRITGGTSNSDSDIFEAWKTTMGSKNITIAIIDSGLDIGHPDLDQSRIVEPQNFEVDPPTSEVTDTSGHGTHVTGIIAASVNSIGVAGIDKNCKIMPLKVIPMATLESANKVANAIHYAIDDKRTHKANILSLSFGNANYPQRALDVLKSAISDAIESGVLVVAAAGNDNRNTIDYPARFKDVIGVGAMSPCNARKRSTLDNQGVSCDNDSRKDGNVTIWGSNYGSGLDLVAPGVLLPTLDIRGENMGLSKFSDQYQSDPNGDYILDSFGTSVATPFAAGVASLVWSANPNLKNYQVAYILNATAKDINDPTTGNGSINAAEAVCMAQEFNVNVDYVLSDLAIELVSLPNEVVLGNSFQAQVRVTNKGDIDAPASSITTKMNFLGSNINQTVYTNTMNISGLKKQESKLFTINIPVDYDICEIGSTGRIKLEFQVDKDDIISEINSLNNEISSTAIRVNFLQNLPDTTIKNLTAQILPDNTLDVSFDIENRGDGLFIARTNGGGFEDNRILVVYTSDDPIYSPSTDLKINRKSLVGFTFRLCPRSSINQNLDGKDFTSNNLRRYLIVIIDPDNLTNETNDTNNFAVIDLQNTLNTRMSKSNNNNNNDSLINFDLFPNPSSENITIHTTKKGIINIIDITGSRIESRNVTGQKSKFNINIDSYSNGLYLIEFVDESGNKITKKLIKN